MLQPSEPNLFAALADALETNWRSIARPEQIEPAGDWHVWLLLSGRGFGKTRTGAEWVLEQVAAGKRRIALVAPTAADARDVMVEGESGILSVSPDWSRPTYEPSKRRLTWPSGAIATTFSADEPERLRGPQHDAAWCDELGSWRFGDDAWSNLQMGLRLGERPRCVVTTTPRTTKIIRALVKREGQDVVVTRGRTADNAQNLAPSFLRTIEAQYAGTRLGRQELDGELLTDTPGALWTRAMIEDARVALVDVPDFTRIVVAIDPAATSGEGADETGIVCAGLGHDGKAYVLEDRSGRYSPTDWAREAIAIYHRRKADRLIAERNNGGEMVENTIRVVDPSVSLKTVVASRGKIARAEPVSALYEQKRVKHVGCFPLLEDQLCDFAPGAASSPDRLDALVWALTELMLGVGDGTAIIEFYRRLVQDEGRGAGRVIEEKAERMVAMLAPADISTVYLKSGRAVTIGEDRKITISEDDAKPLEQAGFMRADAQG